MCVHFYPFFTLVTTGAVCVRVALRGGCAGAGARTAYDEGFGGTMTRERKRGEDGRRDGRREGRRRGCGEGGVEVRCLW